jgi:hypothetical protein
MILNKLISKALIKKVFKIMMAIIMVITAFLGFGMMILGLLQGLTTSPATAKQGVQIVFWLVIVGGMLMTYSLIGISLLWMK